MMPAIDAIDDAVSMHTLATLFNNLAGYLNHKLILRIDNLFLCTIDFNSPYCSMLNRFPVLN